MVYEVDSIDAADPLVTALARDLGLGAAGDPVEPALPRGVRGDLTVERSGLLVTVAYRSEPDLFVSSVDRVLQTLGAVASQ